MKVSSPAEAGPLVQPKLLVALLDPELLDDVHYDVFGSVVVVQLRETRISCCRDTCRDKVNSANALKFPTKKIREGMYLLAYLFILLVKLFGRKIYTLSNLP